MKKKVFAILMIISLVIGVMPMISINKVVAAETVSQSETCRFSGRTLELGGKIGVNFYVSSDANLAADDYAEFVLENGGKQIVKMSEATETSYGVKFTCWVPAKEMADTITATLYKDGEAQHTVTTSVKEYAEIILQSENYASAHSLANAMLNYGAYAQKLFEYNTDGLANNITGIVDEVSNVVASQLEGFKQSKQGLDNFGSLYGTTLVLKGDTKLRMYFKFAETASLEGLTFTIGGVAQDYTTSGEYYIVDIANISAYDLDEDYTVTVTAGDHSFEAKCSALTYCYNALVNSDDTKLHNVAKALYLYNAAVEQYRENLTNNEARIGETYYVTFEEAVSAAASSTEKPIVHLLKDVEVSSTTTVASGQEFTIQSEGNELYSITCSDTAVDLFEVEGTLTLSNVKLLNGAQAIDVLSGGTVNAGGITISGSNGYAINNAGKFCIKSGEEVKVSGGNSYGLYNNSGIVCMEKGETDTATLIVDFQNSNTKDGIYGNYGSINVSDITVKNLNGGRGIFLNGTATKGTTLTATTVSIDTATNQGIQVNQASTLTVTNLNVSNIPTSGKNALWIYNKNANPTVTITTMTVKNCYRIIGANTNIDITGIDALYYDSDCSYKFSKVTGVTATKITE